MLPHFHQKSWLNFLHGLSLVVFGRLIVSSWVMTLTLWTLTMIKIFESLPCDLNYAVVCLILPALNGLLNGFLWPAYTLYFQENGWPVVRAGLAQGLGFCFRVLTQQMQLAAGYWLIVPLAVIHLTFAVLGLIYFDQEWAVFAEILVVFTIDPTCAIEGLAFDTFGNSEVQARQAASTSLSVYTICVASACTIGGIAYDFFSWKGTATFHTICQSLLLFMLAIQPSMRQSFMEVWFPAKEPEKIEEDQEENSKRAPNTPNTDAASGAEVTKVAFAEKLEEDQEENSTRTLNTYAASGAEVANLTFSENFEEYQMESSTRTLNTYAASGAEVANLTFSENFEEYQVESSTRTPNKRCSQWCKWSPLGCLTRSRSRGQPTSRPCPWVTWGWRR